MFAQHTKLTFILTICSTRRNTSRWLKEMFSPAFSLLFCSPSPTSLWLWRSSDWCPRVSLRESWPDSVSSPVVWPWFSVPWTDWTRWDARAAVTATASSWACAHGCLTTAGSRNLESAPVAFPGLQPEKMWMRIHEQKTEMEKRTSVAFSSCSTS